MKYIIEDDTINPFITDDEDEAIDWMLHSIPECGYDIVIAQHPELIVEDDEDATFTNVVDYTFDNKDMEAAARKCIADLKETTCFYGVIVRAVD